MTSTDFKDTILSLVSTETEKAYAGTKVNDRTLGKMFFIKRYERAAKELYDGLRELMHPPITSEKQAFANDGVFVALVQQRMGVKRLDQEAVLTQITELLYKLQVAQKVKTPSKNAAAIEAAKIMAKCTTYSKDSTTITVIENKQ